MPVRSRASLAGGSVDVEFSAKARWLAETQGLAQLALAWGLRDERVTSLVIGASSVDQLEQNGHPGQPLAFGGGAGGDDRHVTADGSVDVWREAREGAL